MTAASRDKSVTDSTEGNSGSDVAPSAPRTPATPPGEARPRKRGRGRPARLSRDGIVAAVLAMIDREPHEVPTIARIAQEVDAVPAALYRHFESLDDILDSVLTRILETSDTGIADGAAWQDQLTGWMNSLRNHLLHYPALLSMIGRSERTSPAWLEISSTLVVILQHAGLGGRDLAATYLWILETTVGLVIQEAALPLSAQVENARASRKALSELARARFSPLAAEIAQFDGESFFAFAVEQAVASVEQRAQSARNDR